MLGKAAEPWGGVYSGWLSPYKGSGELLRHSSHAWSEPMATRRHRGDRAGGSNSLGIPRSESHPARVAQHKHGPTAASGMQATPQIRGKPSEQQEIQAPMPTCHLPDPRAWEPRAAEPWDSLGTVSVGPAQELPPVPARAPHCKPAQTHLHRGCASTGAGPQTSAPLPTHTAWLGLCEAPSGCCHLPATVLHRDETQPAPLA